METEALIEADWPFVLSMLPGDLEETAREHGALVRKREIKCAQDLLRLGLAYSICGFSLRKSALWSQQEGLAKLSNVAVLKRLRSATNWFCHLLTAKLLERMCLPQVAPFRIRLLDATAVSVSGSQKTDWRIHVGFDLAKGQMDTLLLTDQHVGESLMHFNPQAGEIWIADRGYLSVDGVQRVVKAQAHIILRLPPHRAALYDKEGHPITLLPLLKQLGPGQVLDLAVNFGKGDRTTPGRLVALPKTPQATEESQCKVKNKARKNKIPPSEEALALAGYFFVFTSLKEEQATASQILELYRFRWQIELNFKRLKSLLKLDEFEAKDPLLCRSLLSLKLLSALLIEELSERFRSFSPWGYTEKGLVHLAPLPTVL